MIGTLETTFRLVGGSLSWSEKPYFHKGVPLQMVPKLSLSALAAIFRELSDRDTKSGSQIGDSARRIRIIFLPALKPT